MTDTELVELFESLTVRAFAFDGAPDKNSEIWLNQQLIKNEILLRLKGVRE